MVIKCLNIHWNKTIYQGSRNKIEISQLTQSETSQLTKSEMEDYSEL